MELDDAYTMATDLVTQHGLDGWSVRFDHAKRRAGICRFEDRVIGLSAALARLHERAEVRETVLHEVAHALVGPRHGHDEVWRSTARAIGGTAQRCLPTDAPRVAAPWLGVCPGGHPSERHRRPERVLTCRRCHPAFSLAHLVEWTYRGRPATMHPNYVAELDRLQRGQRLTVLPVGSRVRVIASGQWCGRVGSVVKRGRTSYHVRLPEGTLRVLFSGVEPVR